MFWLFVTIVGSVLLVDIVYIGNLYKIFRIWPAIADVDMGRVVYEESVFWSKIYTDDKVCRKYINDCMTYISIVIAENYIYFKNSRKTYVHKFSVDDIDFFYVRKRIIKNSIYFKMKNSSNVEICPFYLRKWVDILKSLSIRESDQKPDCYC